MAFRRFADFADCLSSHDFDGGIYGNIDSYPEDFDLPQGHGSDQREAPFEHPCHELKNLLSSGTFYYSVDFDLTNRLQDR